MELSVSRALEAGITFIVIEAVGFFTLGNPTAPLSLAITAATLVYTQGINADDLQTLIADIESLFPSTNPQPIVKNQPISTTPSSISWLDFLALNATQSNMPVGTIIATTTNPTSKKIWYAVVSDDGSIVETNIKPA